MMSSVMQINAGMVSAEGLLLLATLCSQDALTIQPCLFSSLYHPLLIMPGVKVREDEQDVTHFQLSALSNEDHVAKQPSVSFHDNPLGFSFGWFTLHCSEGLQLYLLNVIMETISLLHSLLFEFLVGMFSFLTRCQQVSGYIKIII